MYSCDMCLEFQRKSDGLLTSDWIEHIATEAVEAMRLLFPEDFDDSAANTAVSKVKTLMQFSAANFQEEVDRYYNRM